MWLKRLKSPNETHKKAVFVSFLCNEKFDFFKTSQELSKELGKDLFTPLLLIFSRFDNRFGFIGGSVEEGEDIVEALLREVKEEVPGLESLVEGYFKTKDFDVFIHTDNKFDFILYLFYLNFSDFKNLLAFLSKQIFDFNINNNKEILGMVVFPVFPLGSLDKEKEKMAGIYGLLNLPVATGVKEEIICILSKLLKEEDFKKLVNFYNIPEYVYTF